MQRVNRERFQVTMLLLMDLSLYSSEITVQILFSVSDTGGDTQERDNV